MPRSSPRWRGCSTRVAMMMPLRPPRINTTTLRLSDSRRCRVCALAARTALVFRAALARRFTNPGALFQEQYFAQPTRGLGFGRFGSRKLTGRPKLQASSRPLMRAFISVNVCHEVFLNIERGAFFILCRHPSLPFRSYSAGARRLQHRDPAQPMVDLRHGRSRLCEFARAAAHHGFLHPRISVLMRLQIVSEVPWSKFIILRAHGRQLAVCSCDPSQVLGHAPYQHPFDRHVPDFTFTNEELQSLGRQYSATRATRSSKGAAKADISD
jgi:hypothetical protein